MADEKPDKLVDIDDIVKSKNPLFKVVKKPASKILGLDLINDAYARAFEKQGHEQLEADFFYYLCDELGIDFTVNGGSLSSIPKEGPVVVLANHPYGLADGLLLGKILTGLRKDTRIVANEQLNMCEEIRPWLIAVDPFETQESKKKNLKATREMLGVLKKGGLLGVFPAGSASSFSLRDKCVIDDNWNQNIAAIIRKTGATVVTIHFPGRNSLIFQGVSLVKKEARVALLPRELKRSKNKTVKIQVSSPLSASSLKKFATDRGLIDYLKLITYCQGRKVKKRRTWRKEKEREMTEIIPPQSVEVIKEEIRSLPDKALLLTSGKYEVYVAGAKKIPNLLVEIGRLREETFRAVGEGSGTECDLDPYDRHYLQLFLWDAEAERLVGGYRLGRTDKILAKYGVKGLYNSQFFTFEDEVLERLNPALEMGRSFIVQDYQKKPIILGLIWQGIGHYVARYPHYRNLFGVVSTSNDYDSFSFRLIVDFLKFHAMDEEMASKIKAKNPAKGKALKPSEVEALVRENMTEQDLSDLVSQLETDGKGIPVLLRQYLKLNGKILGFNIDKDFGGVLDCMVMVDLFNSPRRSLKKYMGKEAVAKLFPDEE